MTKKKITPALPERRTISVATLERLGACQTHQDRFVHAFNVDRLTRVEINAENLERARRQGIMVAWLLKKVLSRQAMNSYNTKRRELAVKAANGNLTQEEYSSKRAALTVEYLRKYWSKK